MMNFHLSAFRCRQLIVCTFNLLRSKSNQNLKGLPPNGMVVHGTLHSSV